MTLLNGTNYSDTYHYNLGDGSDTIVEPNNGTTDTIILGDGITTADVTISRNGSDLVLTFANAGDKITIQNVYVSSSSSCSIESLIFADGVTWTGSYLQTKGLEMQGTAGNDILSGSGSFGDPIYGNEGDDTLYGYHGNDSLYGGSGNDKLYGGNDQDTLEGGDGNDILDGESGSDVLTGGAGDDTMGNSSTSSNEYKGYNTDANGIKIGNTYTGGTGTDKLYGTQYADTYYYNMGDGADTINDNSGSYGISSTDSIMLGAGITTSDVTITRNGNDLVLTFANAGDKITIQNWYAITNSYYRIESVVFADGSTWTSDYLNSMGLIVQGTSSNDSLYGTSSFADFMYGNAGDDTLYGYDMDDSLHGDTGNDKLYGGTGQDTLEGGDGNDTLDGESGSDILIGGAGNDTLGNSYTRSNEYLGCTTNANGILIGNQYTGGTDSDTLYGTKYADTYYYNIGDGTDTISDYSTVGSTDTLTLGGGIDSLDVTLTQSGNNLVMQFGSTGDQITINNWYSGSSYQVENITTSDGDLLLNSQVDALIQAMAGFCADKGGITWDEAKVTYQDEATTLVASYWQTAA